MPTLSPESALRSRVSSLGDAAGWYLALVESSLGEAGGDLGQAMRLADDALAYSRGEFEEGKHPRDEDGRFASGGSLPPYDDDWDVEQIGYALRDVVLEASEGSPKDACILAAATLKRVYPEAELYYGVYDDQPHLLAKLGGYFLDVTADQFNPKEPEVAVLDPDDLPQGYWRFKKEDEQQVHYWTQRKDAVELEPTLRKAFADMVADRATWGQNQRRGQPSRYWGTVDTSWKDPTNKGRKKWVEKGKKTAYQISEPGTGRGKKAEPAAPTTSITPAAGKPKNPPKAKPEKMTGTQMAQYLQTLDPDTADPEAMANQLGAMTVPELKALGAAMGVGIGSKVNKPQRVAQLQAEALERLRQGKAEQPQPQPEVPPEKPAEAVQGFTPSEEAKPPAPAANADAQHLSAGAALADRIKASKSGIDVDRAIEESLNRRTPLAADQFVARMKGLKPEHQEVMRNYYEAMKRKRQATGGEQPKPPLAQTQQAAPAETTSYSSLMSGSGPISPTQLQQATSHLDSMSKTDLVKLAKDYGLQGGGSAAVLRQDLADKLKQRAASRNWQPITRGEPSGEQRKVVKSAFDRLAEKHNNFVSFDTLAKESGITDPATLHKLIKELQDSGEYIMTGVEGRHGLSDEDRKWLMPDPSNPQTGMGYLSRR